MDQVKEEGDLGSVLGSGMAGVSSVPMSSWTQSAPGPAPHAHMAGVSQQHPVAPPPAHAHPSSANQKPPDSFLDKGLIEAAAFLDGKSMSLPVKSSDSASPSTEAGGSSLPWALLQQYGQFMLDRKSKPSEVGGATVTATVTTDTVTTTQNNPPASVPQNPVVPKSEGGDSSDPNTIEAQRDVYRRMLNYSMSSALTQQYYLSQYGYNYHPFSKSDTSQISTPSPVSAATKQFCKSDTSQTSTPSTATAPSHSSTSAAPGPPGGSNNNGGSLSPISAATKSQLPSIDSVLLNLSTKKTGNHTGATTTEATPAGLQATTAVSSVPAYGLQALANAAIEADPKAFSEAHHAEPERKDKSELSDITDTDDSNMSPSDSSTSQILSPTRNTYSHLLDTNPHISIPAAHSHSHNYPSVYQSKGAAGSSTLPSIQHFSGMGKNTGQKTTEVPQNVLPQLSAGGIKPSDLVAAAMKLKVEPSEEREKEIADRTIQERIAAHQLNAVQQQVQDLTAGALAADAAALLAKLPLGAGSNLEQDLHRHMERVYDYDHDTLQALQQEPIELTADGSPGKANSRRKSRGRPTSIESLRDPLARQSSTSSLGGNTSLSGDGEDRTYDCEICGKQFSHNDRLRRHRKIHTSEKPYKCDICGKGFKEKCNLKHHRFIHTGEKPYKCETCAKSFNQRSSLKTHQKVHTGEKPFKCELCQKPFAQKYLLRQHMKKHIELSPLSAGTPQQQQQQQQ